MKNLVTKIVITITGLLLFTSNSFAVTIDDLLTKPNNQAAGQYQELDAVRRLPELTLGQAVSRAIQIILGLTMAVTIVAIVFIGINLLVSQGDSEKVAKAKGIIIYLAIGVGVMAAAYAVISGVVQINIFEVDPST